VIKPVPIANEADKRISSLCVIVPDNIKSTKNATMWVTGWSNTASLPTSHDEDILLSASLAMGTGLITGSFFQVPNEKMIFSGDPEQMSRGEDAIIAYTWDHFLKDPDSPEWLVRLPMVKSVLRAMDAMTEFVATKLPQLECQLDYYTVAGASKRGWTTWLMGAVDPERVVAIVPIVLDAVNFIEVMHHQYQSYNGWSFALEDYYHQNITGRFDDPNMHKLSQIEDPYFYFDRLTMPKLVVNAVGDEFQQPDDTHYWWSDLPQPKHFLMVPNAEHSLATGILEVTPAIGTWIAALLVNKEVPQMDWKIDQDAGTIQLKLDGTLKPLHVRKYYAYTCNDTPRRDFRFVSADDPCTCGIGSDGSCVNLKSFWKWETLKPTRIGGNEYIATHETPEQGWSAFFIDVTYRNAFKNDDEELLQHKEGWLPKDRAGLFEFTTEVAVVPNTFPYKDCHYEGCTGVLV
jgi:PhoPQ-activated pathogenicity-related protein